MHNTLMCLIDLGLGSEVTRDPLKSIMITLNEASKSWLVCDN
jgi:hypothetical protein